MKRLEDILSCYGFSIRDFLDSMCIKDTIFNNKDENIVMYNVIKHIRLYVYVSRSCQDLLIYLSEDVDLNTVYNRLEEHIIPRLVESGELIKQ